MFNSEAYISESITSVINQSYTHWELLLIDDNSKDNTLKIAETFSQNRSNIKLFKNSHNCGAAISRNKGINQAKGEYIAFLDADDLWKPNKLKVQIAFMKNNDCDISFSSYDLMDEKGYSLGKVIRSLKVLSYNKLLKSNYVGNLTGMYHAQVLGQIMTPNLRKRQDWLLWLFVIKKSGKPALGIQESLAYYRVRKDSISSNKFHLLKYNYWVYKKGLGYSTFKSVYCMLIFLKEQFFVKSKQVQTISTI